MKITGLEIIPATSAIASGLSGGIGSSKNRGL